MAERRMELDAVLKCPHCGGAPYKVFRRQHANFVGTDREQLLTSYEHVLWPAHPDVPPPKTPERICCPDCGNELRRVAP